MNRPAADRRTRVTVLVALAANLVIAAAGTVGGLFSGSPAQRPEAAYPVADTLNEIFPLAALRRSRRPADARHPFGYGKERFFRALTLRRASGPGRGPRCAAARVGRRWVLDRSGRPRAAHP